MHINMNCMRDVLLYLEDNLNTSISSDNKIKVDKLSLLKICGDLSEN